MLYLELNVLYLEVECSYWDALYDYIWIENGALFRV